MKDILDTPDPRLSRLRALVGGIEIELDNIGKSHGESAAAALRSTWSELVKALALGVEPELRACPVCTRAIVLEASRCRYCWTRSNAG